MPVLQNFECQVLPPFTPFSLQQQSPSEKAPYPSYSSTVEEQTDPQNRSPGARFKIPYHYEVLHPSPLVSLEGDLAKQFALYNYITSQKDSDGNHLCSHFFEIPSTRENPKYDQTFKSVRKSICRIPELLLIFVLF